MVGILAARPICPWLIPSFPEIVNVGEINQLHSFGEIGQRLKIVERTHLVLARGKFVLQEIFLLICNLSIWLKLLD